MRKASLFGMTATALLLAGCGPKQLALPSDPVDRAATCAVVSAAQARAGQTDIKGDLNFAAQTRIVHYAMLAGAEDKAFSSERASAVVTRMGELQEKVTEGKWQQLEASCDAAYPAASKTAGIELPKAKFDAELGCYAMGDFLTRSVSTNDVKGQEELSSYNKMKRDLDGPVGAGLAARGASKYEKSQVLKNEALSGMTKLGAPVEVMKMCTGRFA